MRLLKLAVVFAVLSAIACGDIDKEVRKGVKMRVHGRDRLCTSEGAVVDIGATDAFKEYRDKIESIELTRVQAKITNPNTSGDSVATKAGGKAFIVSDAALFQPTVGDDGSDEPSENVPGATFLASFGDVAITQDNIVDIEFDKAGADKIIEMVLNPPHSFFAFGRGCADAKPNFFEYEIIFTFKIHGKVVGADSAVKD